MNRQLTASYRGPRARGGWWREAPVSRGWFRPFVAASLATVGCVLVGMGLRGDEEPPSPSADAWGALSRPAVHGPSLLPSEPTHLDIPSVAIHTRLLRLGLNDDGTLQVPWRPLLAGWYEGSSTPGAQGPAVIAGHVDSLETGPAVFYRLGELTPGDTIRVSRQDGTRAVFGVTAVRFYPRSDFPTAAVYGDSGLATMRLITCADWDEEAQEYAGNVIVFADLVGPGRSSLTVG